MAKNDIGPRIGIDGEKEYRKQMENIIQQAKTLDSEMRLLASTFTQTTTAQEKNNATAKVLNKQIQVQEQQVKELANMLEKCAKEFGENDTRTLKYKAALNDATAELNRMQGELQDITTYTHRAGKEMDDSGKKASTFGDMLKANLLGDIITSSMHALADAIKRVGSELFSIVAEGADFEAQMSKVEAISGATEEEIALLEQTAREMGRTTVFNAGEAGAALEYMAMAGWKAEDMIDGLPGVMNLAAASGEDLATVSDIVTDALTAFGLDAAESARFADVLAKASSSSNTNVAMMGESFKYAGTLAGALGYSIEDVSVAIGLMANAGIKSDMAGTALRGVLSNLSKPSDQVAGYMDKLGVSLTDAAGEMLPLSELIQNLRSSFSELTEAEKAEYAAGIAGKNAMSGMLALINASDEDFNSLTEAIANSSGTAEEMAQTMTDNLKGSFTLLKSAVSDIGIEIYNQTSGPLKEAVDMMTALFSREIDLSQFIGQFSRLVTSVAANIRAKLPELLQTGGEMLRAVLQGVNDLLPEVAGIAIPLFMSLATGFLENLPMLLEIGGTLIMELAEGIIAAAPDLIRAATDTGIALAEMFTAPENISAIIEAGVGLLMAVADGLLEALPRLLDQVPVIIDNVVTALMDNLDVLIPAGIELILAVAGGMIAAIPQILAMLPKIFDSIKNAFAEMDWLELGRKIIQGLINGLESMLSALWDSVKSIAGGILNRAKDALGIHSPSSVFEDEVGRMIPAGLTLGIDKAMPAALRDMRTQFAALSGIHVPQATTANTNYGGVTINVQGAPGQDVGELADIIMQRMDSAVRRKEAVYA